MRRYGYCFNCNRILRLRNRKRRYQCGTCGKRDILVARSERILEAMSTQVKTQLLKDILQEIDNLKEISDFSRTIVKDRLTFKFG